MPELHSCYRIGSVTLNAELAFEFVFSSFTS